MNLPNYFLADLPPQATITETLISEACETLKKNRQRYLLTRPVAAIIRSLATVGENWLSPDYHLRRLALEQGPALTGFSAPVLQLGLDTFFKQLTRENLQALVLQDLGHLERAEKLSANESDARSNRAARVRGPALLVHVAPGNIPNPAFMSIVLGLLVRSAQFVKCATGSSFLPRLFAHSLHEVESKLGACLEIVEWKGGTERLDSALFAQADLVTATGDDAALSAIRQSVPREIRFLGYGNRLSFTFVTHEMLAGIQATRLIARAAEDICAWDQQGCLSPHVIYVESGGTLSPQDFAAALALALEKMEENLPRATLSPDQSGTIAYRRSFYEVRAAGSAETSLWQSAQSTAWTVVYESEPRFQESCLNRFVYVKGVADMKQLLQSVDHLEGKISTVALAAPEDRAECLANELSEWGVTRICPVGQMQNPPLLWRHDGRPALADLVTWTDWEF